MSEQETHAESSYEDIMFVNVDTFVPRWTMFVYTGLLLFIVLIIALLYFSGLVVSPIYLATIVIALWWGLKTRVMRLAVKIKLKTEPPFTSFSIFVRDWNKCLWEFSPKSVKWTPWTSRGLAPLSAQFDACWVTGREDGRRLIATNRGGTDESFPLYYAEVGKSERGFLEPKEIYYKLTVQDGALVPAYIGTAKPMA